MNEPDLIHSMLGARTIAVVGLSDRPDRPSHYVSAYIQKQGYTIYPVNPSVAEVLGVKCYPTLTDLPLKPDLVNVFRVSSLIPAIIDEMLMLGLKDIWVQQGIVNHEAAARAERGGIRVVMDRCLMVEHRHARLP
jgi:predicted CoA-binding protein